MTAEEFRRQLNVGLEITGFSDAEFAEIVGTSRPTVTRWKNGASVPHERLRDLILDKFLGCEREKTVTYR